MKRINVSLFQQSLKILAAVVQEEIVLMPGNKHAHKDISLKVISLQNIEVRWETDRRGKIYSFLAGRKRPNQFGRKKYPQCSHLDQS